MESRREETSGSIARSPQWERRRHAVSPVRAAHGDLVERQLGARVDIRHERRLVSLVATTPRS